MPSKANRSRQTVPCVCNVPGCAVNCDGYEGEEHLAMCSMCREDERARKHSLHLKKERDEYYVTD